MIGGHPSWDFVEWSVSERINQMPTSILKTAAKMVYLSFAFVVALSLGGCRAKSHEASVLDPTGTYKLISVDGSNLPANVSHDGVPLRVQAGTFVISSDGTCSSKVTFELPSQTETVREVNATFRQDGSDLVMQWEGAGKTTGSVAEKRFTMTNEGIVFAYEKLSSL